jgi:hypothetical protein
MEVLTVQATAADQAHQLTSLWARAVIQARCRWVPALILGWEVQALGCLEALVQDIQAWAVLARIILAWGVRVQATI